jgi:hypothetical protein
MQLAPTVRQRQPWRQKSSTCPLRNPFDRLRSFYVSTFPSASLISHPSAVDFRPRSRLTPGWRSIVGLELRYPRSIAIVSRIVIRNTLVCISGWTTENMAGVRMIERLCTFEARVKRKDHKVSISYQYLSANVDA